MAPKRQPPPPPPPLKPPSPPPADSSEDEYEDSEEEENASEDSGQQSGSDASVEDDSKSEQEQATPKPMPSDGKSTAKSSEPESKGDGAPLDGTQVETAKKSFRKDRKTLAANGGRAKRSTNSRSLDLAGSCPVLTREMVALCKQNVGLSENYVRARINAADESKLQPLEERWRKQKLEEASLLARKKALEADILAALMR